MEKLIAKWNQANPDIQVKGLSQSDYQKQLTAITGGNPPETFKELEEYVAKLSVQQDGGRLERLGLWPGMDAYALSFAFGGSFYDAESKQATPDHEGVKKAISFSKVIWDQYGSESLDRFSSGLGQYMSAQNPFFTGKYAMTIDGEWLPTFIKQFAPNLNYGIAPIPYDDSNPDMKNSGNVTTSVFYIPKGVKNPDESWKFLKWVTEREQMAEFTAALGNLPTRTSVFDNPIYNDVPGFKEFLAYSSSPNLRSFPASSYANEYMIEFATQYDAILRGKIGIDEGLNKVKEKIQLLVK